MSTAVVYGRFSNKEKEDKAVTLESQIVDERARAERDGYEVVGEFADDGYSAYNPKVERPDWLAMLDYVEANNIDRIYTRDTDRTSRQMLETAQLIAFCVENGVTLVEGGSITRPDDDDAQDMRSMRSMFDSRYSRTISKNTRRARAKEAEAGKSHGGMRPFGWNDDRKTLHPIEGPAYRELFDRVIAGEGVGAIVRDWADRGIRNSKGERYDVSVISKLVKAPRAIGKRTHKGKIVADGTWEPIVDAHTQAQAMAAMKLRRPRRMLASSTQRPPRLLSSIVVCDECGGRMRVRTSRNSVRYVCDRSKSVGCGTSVKAEHLEHEVATRLMVVLRAPETRTRLDRLRAVEPDASDLIDEIERLRGEMKLLAQKHADDEIDIEEWLILRKGKQKKLDAAVVALEQASDCSALLAFDPLEVADGFGGMGQDEQSNQLGRWIDAVRVSSVGGVGRKNGFDGDRVHVDWRL